MLRVFLSGWFVHFLFFPTPVRAQLHQLPFDEIINQSTLVVEGRVVAQESFWDNPHRNIFTKNTIELSRIFKGAAPSTLQVITWGGIVGDKMQLVSESVQYGIGDAGLFCLVSCNQNLPVPATWENFGSPHGFFQYNLSENRVEHPFHSMSGINAFRDRLRRQTGEQEILLPGIQLEIQPANRATPVISSFSPTSITAGTESNLTISGSNFNTAPGTNGTVRFRDSNTGSWFSVDDTDIISWSDNEIVVEVPSRTAVGGTAGTGMIEVRNSDNQTGTSTGTLTVEFAHSNVLSGGIKYIPRLVDFNGNGGMTFTLSTSICNDQDATNAFGRALRAWRCASGVNWVIESTTTSDNSTGSDAVNIVTFDIGTPLPNGVLGRTTSFYTACWDSGWQWFVEEIDVNMNNSYTWYYCDDPNPNSMPGSSFDFQSVAFHELGHGHQLSHIIDGSAVMHRSISNNTIKRTLNPSEEAGANYALGLSANPCGPGPMALISPANCTDMTMPSDCDDAGPCTLSLPVELASFAGKAEKTGILLEWETASEHNNAFFTLERSADAVHFEALVQIPGAISSSQPKRYSHFDSSPLPGVNYYRLRQTDLDGSVSFPGMIAVSFGEAQAADVQVFPNPVDAEMVYVQAESVESGTQIELLLTDLSGKLIRRQLEEVGSSLSEFQLSGVPSGSYWLFVYLPANRQILKRTLLVKP